MSIQTTPEADQATGVIPAAPWRIKALSRLPDYRLAVTFITIEAALGQTAKKNFLPRQDGDVQATYGYRRTGSRHWVQVGEDAVVWDWKMGGVVSGV